MSLYPFCVVGDVQAYNQHAPTYATGTQPTLAQVEKWILDIAASLRSVIGSSGYDLANLQEKKDTVALAIAAGTAKTAVVTDPANFTAGDVIHITGSASGILKHEFANVTVVVTATKTITIDTLANSYDAATVTIYVVNEALRILRELNALGAASLADESVFMGVSPNKSEHAEVLWKRYQGAKSTANGLWAIQNLEDYLLGASQTTEAVERATISSYGSEHSDDSDVEPLITNEMYF
jgi:hypothetical protein